MNRNLELPIIGALIAAMAPHMPGLPPWINLWCLTLWGYMLLRPRTGWPLPRAWIKYSLTLVSLLGLILTFRFRIGGDAFVGLLALMAGIKPFEMPTHRHRMITILLTYFIIITSLFRSDSLFVFLYMVFSVFITTAALIEINRAEGNFRQSAGLAFSILARALPLVLVLFLIFPRLSDSLFGIPEQALGRTGLALEISPGSIARMVQDQTPAFRVEFEGPIPPADQLYWRGLVFEVFDGRTWKPHAWTGQSRPLGSPGAGIAYTVLMPPNFTHALVGLDRPVEGPAWAQKTQGHSLRSRKKIVQKTAFRATSLLPDAQGAWPRSSETPRILISAQVPNPRARALAREMAARLPDPEAKVTALLDLFREQGFVYSLTPPLAQENPVDSFLFDTRSGFCEHYASAFAFMMNLMGVPARVIGGYLGGELNPYGNYLLVRQAFAHAWTEYFHPERGWVRVDPTLAANPSRLITHPDGSWARRATDLSLLSFLNRAGLILDAVNLKWETWFTGYSSAQQQAWLKRLGMAGRTGMVLGAATLLSVLGFAGLLILRAQKASQEKDPVAAAYGRFLKKLARQGLVPEPGQTPFCFARSCMETRPDLKPDIQSIMDLYLELRYKRQTQATPRDLESRIKRFSPGLPPDKERR